MERFVRFRLVSFYFCLYSSSLTIFNAFHGLSKAFSVVHSVRAKLRYPNAHACVKSRFIDFFVQFRRGLSIKLSFAIFTISKQVTFANMNEPVILRPYSPELDAFYEL